MSEQRGQGELYKKQTESDGKVEYVKISDAPISIIQKGNY